jgi:hypothetical protein
MERRDVDVGSSPQEMPAVVLHAIGGTLLLTSDPTGATVLVDGKKIAQVTPAQIPLPPGKHMLTLEKDGRQSTKSVEVKTGIITLRMEFE